MRKLLMVPATAVGILLAVGLLMVVPLATVLKLLRLANEVQELR